MSRDSTIKCNLTVAWVAAFAAMTSSLLSGLLVPLPGLLTPAPASAQTWSKADKAAAVQRQRVLAKVKSWGYQLRFVIPREVHNSPFDVMVIDHAVSFNKRFQYQISPADIALMKRRPDGSRRIVLSYLSIGEAERYRFYWNQDWYQPPLAPRWLGSMNAQWDGNYLVRFWDPEWQKLLYQMPQSYLDRIKTQGFDGVYLDRADVFEEWKAERAGAEQDMVRLIADLSAAARADDPRFLIVMQNAEELVRHKAVRSSIDAIAKEDLFYGIGHTGQPNGSGDVAWSLKHLKRAKRAGHRIFVVEYLHDGKLVESVMAQIRKLGFVPLATGRGLHSLPQPPQQF